MCTGSQEAWVWEQSGRGRDGSSGMGGPRMLGSNVKGIGFCFELIGETTGASSANKHHGQLEVVAPVRRRGK